MPLLILVISRAKLQRVLVLDHQSAGKVIGPAWTLPYEITYFLLAPLLTLLSLRWFSIVSIVAILNFVDWRFSEISLLLRPFAWGVSGGSVAAQAIMLFILGAFVYRIKQHAHISHPKIFSTR